MDAVPPGVLGWWHGRSALAEVPPPEEGSR